MWPVHSRRQRRYLAIVSTLAGAILLAAAVAAVADEKNDNEKLAAQVLVLVRQLRSDDASERDAAEKRLIELGPAALEHLGQPRIAASERSDAEVRSRLQRVRKQLQKVYARESLQPGRVTLAGKDLPLAAVIEALTKQTGNSLKLPEKLGDAKVSVAFDKTPFWEALDQVLDQARLTLYPYAGEGQLALYPRPEAAASRSGRAAYAGPLRVDATALIAKRQLQTTVPGVLQVELEAAWEPRVRPLAITQSMADVKAVDENGKPIDVANGVAVLTPQIVSGVCATPLELDFQLPPRSTKKIERLEGTLYAMVPGPSEAFAFDKLDERVGARAKPDEVQKGEATVTLRGVRKNGDLWEVLVQVRYENTAGQFESYNRGWLLANPAYLVDEKGNRIEHIALETTQEAADATGIVYVFPLENGPAGLQFVYETPTLLARLPVPYVLKDLELP